MVSSANPTPASPTGDWPSDGLESIAACPVCGSTERSLVHAALTDRIFFCAPGVWAFHRCGGCGCGYLSPRPTPQAIGLAYAEYYTHGLAPEEIFLSSSTLLGRRFPALRNGYLNARFPHLNLRPALALGAKLTALDAATRVLAERDVRHLPTPAEGASLLDIGCGGGEFVRRALRLGYAAEGLEFDAQAVAAATAQGVPVREGALPATGLPADSYDAVTLSQVIEHLHDPLAALAEIHRLLKPGGFFWLATPNMDAPGHQTFGPDWRGLEPPRHLLLFSAAALVLALQKSGFTDIAFQAPGAVSAWFFKASYRISQNAKPDAPIPLPADLARQAQAADRVALANPKLGEELIVTARKP
ncbi:MAG: class I SAM-dependent methyltransferase [Candidatus Methylumidiphilus sp.]